MSDQIEAAGAMVTAGLAASALDQPRSGAAGHGTGATCGAALSGRFCGQCGQRAHLHRTLGAMFHEFLRGITHFDGKARKTLPMLIFRPSKLTRPCIDGQRARSIAPVPLFLLAVVELIGGRRQQFGGLFGAHRHIDGRQLRHRFPALFHPHIGKAPRLGQHVSFQ